jgi:hypothetical protein
MHDDERNERPPYKSTEELKSVREVYIRVAVIDIDISAGNTNIYIGGGGPAGRGEMLEADTLRDLWQRNQTHTMLKRANIRSSLGQHFSG